MCGRAFSESPQSSIRKLIHPFADWQNDLHLIVDIAHAVSLCPRIDLAKLIVAATRAVARRDVV